MKRIMVMLAFVAFGLTAGAQDASVKNGIKLYNYKKYKSAQAVLTPLAEKTRWPTTISDSCTLLPATSIRLLPLSPASPKIWPTFQVLPALHSLKKTLLAVTT